MARTIHLEMVREEASAPKEEPAKVTRRCCEARKVVEQCTSYAQLECAALSHAEKMEWDRRQEGQLAGSNGRQKIS